QAAIFYAMYYTRKIYVFRDSACQSVLGYDASKLMEAGPIEDIKLWHPNDYKIFNEQIFPKMMSFLQAQPIHIVQDYSFTFNYRITTRSGSYKSVLQRASFYLNATNRSPVSDVGFILDISHFKE